jgi:type II secretory pathway component PulM
VSVAFGAIEFDALVGALEALQRDARLRVVEATIAARVEPGVVRAELVLAR